MRHLLGVLRAEPAGDDVGGGQSGDDRAGDGRSGAANARDDDPQRPTRAGVGIDLDAALAPRPGMTDLDALADRVRRAGVGVNLRMSVPHRLPDGVELSIYRIVQEALTNAVKHAAPTTCQVRIDDDAGTVTIDVYDDGPGGGRQQYEGRHDDHGPAHSAEHLDQPGARDDPDRSPDRPDRPAGHGLIGMHERVMVYGGTFNAGPRREGGFAVHATLPYTVPDPPIPAHLATGSETPDADQADPARPGAEGQGVDEANPERAEDVRPDRARTDVAGPPRQHGGTT
ncbi:hypothetical protein EF847_02820 [Actinobacteria bacterium YIM 96077]|uniref:histidine kinase n=2 Tax=Phytoactinopolyspora halophila TaxID=1981511 RepID=A0A329QC03_9ACTN|nr:hypothetical protein EF847_02820 [Actinobacteria bacterium YIM 96077]RAW09864.1 hypothetical protein DPM12_19995 [Phytoactinopolyspora halophila]